MTRIEAALDDLGRLAGDVRELDADLRALASPLRSALDAAWATSGTFLGPRSRVDDALLAHLRAADVTAGGVDEAARRLRLAGADATLEAVPLGGSAAAGRLAAVVAVREGGRAGAGLWSWLRTSFIRPAGPAPYVVSTETRTYGVAAWAEASLAYRRDELSDGSVVVTEVRGGSISTGVGVGAACGVATGGDSGLELDGSAGGDVGLAGAATRTWRFGSAEAADRWWDAHRDELLVDALARATPVVGPGLGLAGSLRDRILGGDDALRPDASSVEASLTGELRAAFGGPAGGVLAGLGGVATVRRNDDGTSTVTVGDRLAATAELRLGDVPGHGPAATVQGELTAELTVSDDGVLQQVVVRSATVEKPGLDPHSGLPASPRLVEAPDGIHVLHVYETTMTLDLADGATQELLARDLGLDVRTTGGAVQAALAATVFDPRVVRAHEVTVLERTTPYDDRWEAGCELELPVLQGSAGVSAGTTTQRTVAAWRKDAGATVLAPLG